MKKILILTITIYISLFSNEFNNPLANNAPELYKFIEKKNYKKVKELLEKGTNPFLHMRYDYKGIENTDTAIGYAIRSSNTKIVQIFLSYVDNIDMPKGMYHPLLFSAVLSENNEMIKFLINKGANINFRSKYSTKDTALEFAFIREKFKPAQYLLDLGAKLEKKDAFKLLDFAITPLKLESLKFLIKNKIDLNYQDEKGNTILHIISKNKIDKNLKSLIKYAETNEFVKKTPGMYEKVLKSINEVKSRWVNYSKIVKMIIDNGADLKLTNKEGKTPFMLAKEYNNEIVLKVIDK